MAQHSWIEPGQDRKVAAIQPSVCVCHFYFMEKNAEYFMRKALREAEKARDMDEVPVGCVIVKDGKIVSRAHNLREKNQAATAHAELLAIQKANKKLNTWCLNECDLYVTLDPCMLCTGAIENARIHALYYGTSDEKAGTVDSLIQIKTLPHLRAYPKEIHSGILKEECAAILSEFFRNKRKIQKNKPKKG